MLVNSHKLTVFKSDRSHRNLEKIIEQLCWNPILQAYYRNYVHRCDGTDFSYAAKIADEFSWGVGSLYWSKSE